MMEAVRTSETSVDNHFTRQYNPEDNSEDHNRRRENLKSHKTIGLYASYIKHFYYFKLRISTEVQEGPYKLTKQQGHRLGLNK
jgi:hypothetical protein